MWAAKRLCSGGLVIPLVDPHLWPHPRSPRRRSSLLQTPCRRQFDDLGTAGRPALRPVDGATALRVVVSGSEGWRASGGRPHLHHPPSHHHPQRRTGGVWLTTKRPSTADTLAATARQRASLRVRGAACPATLVQAVARAAKVRTSHPSKHPHTPLHSPPAAVIAFHAPPNTPQSSRRSASGVLCRLEAKPTSVARGTASYARPGAFWTFSTGCSTRTLLVAALDL